LAAVRRRFFFLSLTRKTKERRNRQMLDEKHEKYWQELDVDDEWKELLDEEHKNMKSDLNSFYYHNKSLNKIGEELVYKINKIQYQNENEEEIPEEHELIKGVSVKKLRSAVRALTDKQRLALELYVFRGYKQDKIAVIMNSSKQNVSKIISGAIIKIKKYLGK
jgi:RNA polymerase sigma factor (sigma-70 family)